jgi:hypothetical protein
VRRRANHGFWRREPRYIIDLVARVVRVSMEGEAQPKAKPEAPTSRDGSYGHADCGRAPPEERDGASHCGMLRRRARCKSGWGGIRTHGGLSPTPVFKTGALNHSATHPVLNLIAFDLSSDTRKASRVRLQPSAQDIKAESLPHCRRTPFAAGPCRDRRRGRSSIARACRARQFGRLP